MNPRESAAVGQLVIEGKHAFWRKGAWVSSWIMARVHGAVVIHCGGHQIRATRKGAGLWGVHGLWVTGRITGVGQVSVTVDPQPFHDGNEAKTP